MVQFRYHKGGIFMKGNMKSFICGMLVMGVISCAGAYATDVWQNINVLPNTIKVVVDGKEVQADNFLYNDTTYLPPQYQKRKKMIIWQLQANTRHQQNI